MILQEAVSETSKIPLPTAEGGASGGDGKALLISCQDDTVSCLC